MNVIKIHKKSLVLFILLFVIFEFDLNCQEANTPGGMNMVFADLNVEAICLQWDADDDGYLSYMEAAAVTDLGNVFLGNPAITSFDELQYFTGLTSIGVHAFDGCSNLSSVVIPSTVTSIGGYAFAGSGLTSIIIPNSVTSIGDWAFANCNSLASVVVLNRDVEMGDEVFNGVALPENTTIAATAFPTEGGGLLGLNMGSSSCEAFIGMVDLQNKSVVFVSQGSGQLSSGGDMVLSAKPNDGWRFVGWQFKGEVVSYDSPLLFYSFGDVAFEALFEVCGVGLEPDDDPDLLSGRFSVSGCSTIGFAKSNVIIRDVDMFSNPLTAYSWLFGAGIPGMHYEIGVNQWDKMSYDVSSINGNNGAYEALLSSGVDIFPSSMFPNNNDCWHIPTWREWDYLLNERETVSGIRFAYGIVNDVSGLIVLPDDWDASIYTLSEVNVIADYSNNAIDAHTWSSVLEPAGAVFLPANGYMVQGKMYQESSSGQAVGYYPGLFISTEEGEMAGLPMTGQLTMVYDLEMMAGMFGSSFSFGGTSLRLAKMMDSSTATVVLATSDAERGNVTGGGEYACQQECTVTATANDGYVFMYWLEDGVAISVDPIYSFKLLGDRNLTAVFAPAEDVCQLDVETNMPSMVGLLTGLGLSVSFDDGIPPYHISFGTSPESLGLLDFMQMAQSATSSSVNTNHTFTINVLRGSNVSLDIMIPEDVSAMNGSLTSDLTFTVSYVNGETIVENTTVPYTFLCNCADVILSVDPEEGGTVEADGALYIGETVTLTAVANEHYSFINWTLNGVEVSTDPTYSFVVTGGGEMVAHFEVEPTYTVFVSINPNEGGIVSYLNPANAFVDFEEQIIPNEWNNDVSSYPWTIWSENPQNGSYCMASSNYDMHNTESFIDVTKEFVEDGSIEFYSRVSSESVSYDWGAFYIDGSEMFREGGTTNTWTTHHYDVTAGSHTFRWCYRKDDIVSSGEDRYFIDNIVFTGITEDNVFYFGETCFLTATPAEGYHFVNWTENGEVVSTENPYCFTVTNNCDLLANFALNYYDITATASPETGGTITGAGTCVLGSECILTAVPNENYTFMYWSEGGNMVSYEANYGFVATGDRTLVAHFASNEQSLSLSPGWTWLSSYIEMENNDGLTMLEDGLNPNGVMIKSQRDGFLTYAAGMWIGTLENICNEKMYLVNTSSPSEVTFNGPVAHLNDHPVTLNPNWTWFGYPSPVAIDINVALANLNPTEGDMVKSQYSFATYSVEDGWYGSLNTLTPGMGLMYQSHNSQLVTFNYSVGMSRSLKANLTAENNHWVPNVHAYPNNMNIMAVVELNGEELQDERYELAAFNGNECRGSARLAYVPSLHRYVAFLTVAGEDDVELYLALYDTMTGKAYYNTSVCPNFEANAVVGNLRSPFVARFGGATVVDEMDAPNIELYPNPVLAGHLFQMEMPAECQGARVSIVNALGAVISTTNVYDEPATLRAPDVPGVYTVRIVTDKQGAFTRKLIVNK